VCKTELLLSWMIWRKWIYDIDNRSAQETGYLFEPILASCLGGEPISAKKSPVKRLDHAGNPTTKGRQIDCYVADENRIYEFKLRVTIAASGQGRLKEELSFPIECQAAGYVPVILVLDPTPSPRLDELEKAFSGAGGFSYKGEDAWKYMEEEAGEVISVFIDKYIKPPIEKMGSIERMLPERLSLCWTDTTISIKNATDSYDIIRTPDEIVEEEEEDDDEI
jgi:hypothetical protein